MPELRHLRAFVAVAEERNFTRAAERLSFAQQAISKAVAQLETELGVALLRRTSHEVELTPAGASLLDGARHVLTAADAAFDKARAIGNGTVGTVQIGCTPAVGPATRRDVRRLLHEVAPEISIAFREIRPHEVGGVLRDRHVEFVLARTHRADPALDSTDLEATPASLFVPEDHRLAGAATVRLGDLDGERLLTWNPAGTPFTDLLVDRLAEAGARVEVVVSQVTGGEDPPDLRRSGAVALLPGGWRAGEGAVPKRLDGPQLVLPLLMLWRIGEPTPAVAWMRDRMGAERQRRSASPPWSSSSS